MAHIARMRPGISPKAFTAFRKNVVAFDGDPPGVGDCAAVEDAEAEGVTTTIEIEDAEAVRSS
jgi:hypothetical protein